MKCLVTLTTAILLCVCGCADRGLSEEDKEEIYNRVLVAAKSFKLDTFDGYSKALDEYRLILKKDPINPVALAYGAFACAVLFGEHDASAVLLYEGNRYTNKAADAKKSKKVSKSLDRAMRGASHDLVEYYLHSIDEIFVAAEGLIELYSGGDPYLSSKIIHSGLLRFPDSMILQTEIGLLLLRVNRLVDACDNLRKCVESESVRAFIGVGECFMRRSMYHDAMKSFSRALKLSKNHTRAFLLEQTAALLNNEHLTFSPQARQAMTHFERELPTNATQSERIHAQLLDAILDCRSSDKETAERGFKRLKKVIEKETKNAFLHFIAAREFRRAGMMDEAEAAIGKARLLDMNRPDFCLEYGRIMILMNRYRLARATANEIRDLDSRNGQRFVLVGEAYLAEKEFDKGLDSFKEAIKYDNSVGIAHKRLGDIYLSNLKDRDRAQAQYELSVQPLEKAGQTELLSEVLQKLSDIYEEKIKRGEHKYSPHSGMVGSRPTFEHPYCLLGSKMNLDDPEQRNKAVDYCKKCVEFGEGIGIEKCKEILKKYE